MLPMPSTSSSTCLPSMLRSDTSGSRRCTNGIAGSSGSCSISRTTPSPGRTHHGLGESYVPSPFPDPARVSGLRHRRGPELRGSVAGRRRRPDARLPAGGPLDVTRVQGGQPGRVFADLRFRDAGDRAGGRAHGGRPPLPVGRSTALGDTVSITAVAPADTVRWVRFQPDGLQFRTNGAGWSALLYTSFSDCGLPTADTLRIAQVTDSLSIIRYLAPPDSTWIKVRKKAWSKGQQYVAGVLHHFSQYAVSW